MRNTAVLCCLLVIPLAFGRKAAAQDTSKAPDSPKAAETAKPPAAPVHYYHFEFVFEELGADGKPVNSRSYAMTASTDPRGAGSVTSGSKSPVVTGAYQGPNNADKLQTQFQYVDVGVKIQARELHETEGQLAFNLKAEASSLAGASTIEGVAEPIIRQNVYDAPVLIPIGKPAVVFKSDALDNKGSMQLVVTATPLH